MLRDVGSDVRSAVRSLRAAPAVAVAAVATLTLGIGATIAIFSVANTLVLRPLPVANPQRLVTITSDTALRHGFHAGAGWNYSMWDRLRQRADFVDGAFAWTLQRFDLADGGEMQPVNTLIATGDMFTALGVPAALGRPFSSADDERGGGREGAVAVISHRLWQRRFAGRPDVIGVPLRIERVPVTIIGVAPDWFRGIDVGQPFDVAIPFATEALVRGARSLVNNDRALLLTVMLRLKPQQRISEAAAALHTMQPDIVGHDAPPFLREPFVVVEASRGISDRSRLRQQYQFPLFILAIVAGVVLIIVCLNVANLLLSRASARRAEVGVRVALGASRWRLIRLCLVEGLTLGCAGTAGGVLLGFWASRALVAQLPFADGGISVDVSIDWRVAAFTTAVALIAVVIFAAAPAFYALRIPPIEALRHAGRGATGRQIGAVSSGLVVMQIALSIVLLTGAGLFGRTLSRLVSVPLGFEPTGIVVVTVNTARSALIKAGTTEVHRQLLNAVAAIPGVLHAAGSTWAPVGTGGGGLLTDARGRRAGEGPQAAFNFVTPRWFETYRITIQSGRDFDDRDVPGAPLVAIVNESLRRRLQPEGGLGSTIHAGPCRESGCTVVGIVADAVYGQSLRDAAPPVVYLPLAQSAALAPPGAPLRLSLRTHTDLARLLPSVTASLRGLDSDLAFTYKRLDQDLDAAVAQERLLAMLAGFFGAAALLLSGVGLYGLSSYTGARRRLEIGIRLALGGQPSTVLQGILKHSTLLIMTGTVLGLVAALWVSRFVAPLLYGLEPRDPITLLTAALTLTLVAIVAAWIPAARATRVDPAQVLRE